MDVGSLKDLLTMKNYLAPEETMAEPYISFIMREVHSIQLILVLSRIKISS